MKSSESRPLVIMDSQYVDMYLRKKKGLTNAAEIPMPQESLSGTAIDRQVERIVRGTYNVQQFVDRTDTIAHQVDTFEDKILNLTKLVKLSQSLQDEKEADLRKQNHELRTRLKRQEQVSIKLAQDLEDLKGSMAATIREAVLSATQPIIQDVSSLTKALQETHSLFERRLAESRHDVKESMTAHFEATLHTRFSQLNETSIERLSQVSTKQAFAIDSLEKRLDGLEGVRLAELRRTVEGHVASSCQMARESAVSEARAIIKTYHESVKEDLTTQQEKVDDSSARLLQLERQSSTLDTALTEFIATFKDSTRVHAAKTDEISNSVREFMALHEQTRNVVASELEGTKQWATRNLHRLKKHIDVINADLAAFRDSHVELSSQLQKVKCHAEAEHDKLTVLLQQKSREASALTEIVDKEIQSIHHITQQHRSSGFTSTAAAATSLSSAAAAGKTAHDRSLYEELAFVGPDRTSH